MDSLAENNGVVKETIEAGTGKIRPTDAALCTVIYKGYFTKSKEIFDSSDGKPVQVVLGDPAKIDGFNIGLETMVIGESAIFRIRSHYAFRTERGGLKFPSQYPEDKKENIKKRKVTYEIKLLDFIQRIDLTKDKRLFKTIIKEGAGKKLPRETDEILCIFC